MSDFEHTAVVELRFLTARKLQDPFGKPITTYEFRVDTRQIPDLPNEANARTADSGMNRRVYRAVKDAALDGELRLCERHASLLSLGAGHVERITDAPHGRVNDANRKGPHASLRPVVRRVVLDATRSAGNDGTPSGQRLHQRDGHAFEVGREQKQISVLEN